jgi:uridine kinase
MIRTYFWSLFVVSLWTAGSAHAFLGKPFIIGVGGGSASGKTHMARMILAALGAERATLVSADNYFAPNKQPQRFYRNGSINYDHPSAVDLKKLALHLQHLRSGYPVTVEEYTFGRPVEHRNMITYEPREFIIVEGIFALYPEIAPYLDFQIFVDVDTETRFRRRLARDQKERGLSEEAVRDYFTSVVEPMHQAYIQPSASFADIAIRSPDDHAEVAKIVETVKTLAVQNRDTKFSVLARTYENAIQEIFLSAGPGTRILSLDEMNPTQEEIGLVNLAEKSDMLDRLVEQNATAFDQPSSLVDYLKRNPIPVVQWNGKLYVIDHHHLVLALSKKGITSFYAEIVDIPDNLDADRLALIQSGRKIAWNEMRDNPYRSLASLLRNMGYIRKTGRPHEEFQWARFFQEYFELHLKTPIGQGTLLDFDEREVILRSAIPLAGSAAAAHLPGFVDASITACQKPLEPLP